MIPSHRVHQTGLGCQLIFREDERLQPSAHSETIPAGLRVLSRSPGAYPPQLTNTKSFRWMKGSEESHNSKKIRVT